MPYGMYLSAMGADVQSQRMEVIANNLANTNTVGFKQQLAVTQARYSEAIERREVSPGSGTINDVGGGVELRDTPTDFSTGAIKQTGGPTDFAIGGQGFFTVDNAGQRMLTRAGNFLIRTDGRLTTQQGHSVLDDNGAPITLDPKVGVESLPGGVLLQGADRFTLGLVRPHSLGDLVRVGENLFSPLAETTRVEGPDRQVLSGHLENSSVSPTGEMMEMIATSRAYEANVRMIQTHDSVIGSLVTRILRA